MEVVIGIFPAFVVRLLKRKCKPASQKLDIAQTSHGAWIRFPDRRSMDHRRYLPMAFRLLKRPSFSMPGHPSNAFFSILYPPNEVGLLRIGYTRCGTLNTNEISTKKKKTYCNYIKNLYF
ncbi:hypothetical protein HS088_TW17G01031 [Tripterygium wilfordii]|uniref:Uncharacterized protein n=1 Tax=Tripterygium wilfordii TaxID=458696 RepID=A0A7J7CHF7_TRIWF|nr:hypothetical protein HS088_TW17G01031 [Tripterygium wilfordii]